MFVFGHVKVRKLYFAKLHTVKKNEWKTLNLILASV